MSGRHDGAIHQKRNEMSLTTATLEVENEPKGIAKPLDRRRAEPTGAPAEHSQRQCGRLVALHEPVPVEAGVPGRDWHEVRRRQSGGSGSAGHRHDDDRARAAHAFRLDDDGWVRPAENMTARIGEGHEVDVATARAKSGRLTADPYHFSSAQA
jgi:hypothetical protein